MKNTELRVNSMAGTWKREMSLVTYFEKSVTVKQKVRRKWSTGRNAQTLHKCTGVRWRCENQSSADIEISKDSEGY